MQTRGTPFLRRLRIFSDRISFFFHSIRFRLTLWSVFILALILLVFSVFVFSRQYRDLYNETSDRLAIRTQQMLGLFRLISLVDLENSPDIANQLLQRETDLLGEYEQMALVAADGEIVQTLGGLQKSTVKTLVNTWQSGNTSSSQGLVAATISTDAADNEGKTVRFVFLVTPIPTEHRLVGWLIIGRPIDGYGQLPRLLVTLAGGSLATLALVLAGGYWLAGRAMSPVRTITRTARGISENGLNSRLRLGTKDELGELADTFDQMLDRLQAAFIRQRQFTADASHELRTPLTIVGLETDHALARKRPVEEYERTLRVIKAENDFMAHLVNDLLTLARMDAGQTQLKPDRLDLSDVSLDVVERLLLIARRDGVELITGELPETWVNGDRGYLTQAISNLVENAIKYSGGVGKHVWINTGSTPDANMPLGCDSTCFSTQSALDKEGSAPAPTQWAWVSIRDDGPGIPAEHLPHLFERFYRVDASRTRMDSAPTDASGDKLPEGSGLGLSIVQWISEAHRGFVRVKSVSGQGTEFVIYLPRGNSG
jgi:signal transduction histidine kinase